MVVYYNEATCCVEKVVHYLQCQGHHKGLYDQKRLSLLYLLNCWSVCNQTWFDSTTSWAWVSCGKTGLLHSRSRSQGRFKMSVNVCPGDIFWITEHFVTKFGMVMQYHQKKKCHAEIFVVAVAIFKVKVTARAHIIKILLFVLYFLNCWFLGNQTWVFCHARW